MFVSGTRLRNAGGGSIWAFFLLGSTVFSGGCAHTSDWLHNGFKVGPNYLRPAAAVADDWIDFNDPRVISDAQCVEHAAWWRTFDDPTIDELVHAAYQQNLPLRVAGLRVLEAQSQRAIAAGLLLPQFQQSFGTYDRIQISKAGSSIGIDPNTLPIPRAFDNWSTGFNVGWEADLWGKFRRNLESADANLDANVEDYDDVLVCLIAETATAYVEMRAFERRLEYARTNVENQQDSLRLAESRFRGGATSKLDVTQAQSNVGRTEALIPVLETGLRQANNRLCVLLGIPPRDLRPELGQASIPTAPPEVVVGIPAELLRRRPDIREAERKVAVQSAQIGVAVADLFPTFTINGSLGWQANKFSDLFESAANTGFISPSFNWNILNYGRIANNINVQDARFQQLAVAYQQTVLSANADVENAIVSFLQAQQQVKALQFTVDSAQESVRLALTQYQEGATDMNRVFVLQSDLTLQQDSLAASQADVALSLIRIYKALGGGWQLRYEAHELACPPAEPESHNGPDSHDNGDSELLPEPVMLQDSESHWPDVTMLGPTIPRT